MTIQFIRKNKDNGKTLNRYICEYCGEVFERWVGTSREKEGKHNTVSSQVFCPQCKNFMKTWGD